MEAACLGSRARSRERARWPGEHAATARGKLYVVGTPIGNLGDFSPRAREALASADLIAAEDTRRTRGLLSSIPAEQRVIAYHEHNEEQRLAELLERLTAGETVALVSDAGTPLISDPGWRLVRAASSVRPHRLQVMTLVVVAQAAGAAGFLSEGFNVGWARVERGVGKEVRT